MTCSLAAGDIQSGDTRFLCTFQEFPERTPIETRCSRSAVTVAHVAYAVCVQPKTMDAFPQKIKWQGICKRDILGKNMHATHETEDPDPDITEICPEKISVARIQRNPKEAVHGKHRLKNKRASIATIEIRDTEAENEPEASQELFSRHGRTNFRVQKRRRCPTNFHRPALAAPTFSARV